MMETEDRGNVEQERKYIKGELVHMIFHNQEEQFSIAKIKILKTNEAFDETAIVVKGYFSQLQKEETYIFYGSLINHSKFGLQYDVEQYQTFIPDSKEGLIAYLSSDLFYGIGEKTAEKIVSHVGTNAISKIMKDRNVLKDIPGLNQEAADNLVSVLKENQGFEQIVMYLSRYQIGLKMAQRIYKEYKEDTVRLIEEDPYQLIYDINGFGFQTADQIARQNGVDIKHPSRIGAGCIYVLQASMQEGHVYLPIDRCVKDIYDLLRTEELSLADIKREIELLASHKRIVIYDENVYLKSLYEAENGFVTQIERIVEHEVDIELEMATLLKIIGSIEESEIISYGDQQFNAIEKALQSKMMILTGGPGTGKTTVINGILRTYADIHDVSMDPVDYGKDETFPFILAAPTGRAAKRMNESTQLPAMTIHRLLGWDGSGFQKDQHDKLAGQLLIIDEFSMVDTWLGFNLFKAIPDDMQVILVGDEDQLPSVGPGQVLTDLLHSEMIPAVALDEVYRQKEGSKIIQLAHEIKNDQFQDNLLQNDQDFRFIPCGEPHLVDVITQIVKKAIDKGMDTKDIQVLAPIYRSDVGITKINEALQALINPKTPHKREVKFQDVVFRIGDKVIQLVNQPEDGIYNGDIGEIVSIFRANENVDKVEQCVVLFDDKEVVYERKQYGNLMHAYCISIHKSQGSEFPNVLLPIASPYMRMLKKNLIYTAITRSKQSLIICGNAKAFLAGVRKADTNIRYTSLRKMLLERFRQQEETVNLEFLTPDDDYSLSPYDFME